LLMDAMLGAKRDRPLTIAGPREATERLKSLSTAMMPGMEVMTPKFPVTYIDMEVFRPYEIGPLKVLSVPPFTPRKPIPHLSESKSRARASLIPAMGNGPSICQD
jgi:hypothetical protein